MEESIERWGGWEPASRKTTVIQLSSMQGLLAEISRKKKANEDLRNKLKASAPETSSKNESGGDAAPPPNIFSKFIRNGDRKRALEEEHMDQQRSHNEEREKKNLAMQQQFEEQARKKEKKENKNKQETDVPTTSVSVEDNNESIDEESSKYKYHICLSLNQLKTRLRAVGQPVTLFGEGIEKETRVRRLLQAQRRLSSSSKGEEEDDEARVKLSKHDEEEAELEADDLEEAQVDKPPTAGDTKTGNESDSDKEGEVRYTHYTILTYHTILTTTLSHCTTLYTGREASWKTSW